MLVECNLVCCLEVECNITRNSDITSGGHVNVSWLSFTALHAGL